MIFYNQPSSLTHHGVRGQKWGVRKYRNKDGTLTDEGREHYGVRERFASATIDTENKIQRNKYRVRRFGNNVGEMLGKSHRSLTKKQYEKVKARRRKLFAIAAGVTIASIGIGLAIHRRRLTTRNLIETARNSVFDRYKDGEKLIKTDREKHLHDYWRDHDIASINSRKAALKEFNLNGSQNRNRVKQFIKNNELNKRKTSEIVEQRTGKLIEGYRRSRITGKMRPYTERYRRKRAEQIVRNRYKLRI